MNTKESKIIKTSCRMCHGVCQVLVHMEGDKVVKVSGNPDSPTSAGYICAKAIAAPQLLYHPDRLKYPMRRKGGRGENRWQRITWEEALDEITQKLSDIKTNFGSEYFALMQGTGRPHTVFNARFANAFGTPNFSAPGHICFFPRVVASGVTMGELPVSDVYGFSGEMPKCIILWGCNITKIGASDGLCGHIVQKAVKQAEQVIVIDPRRIGAVNQAKHWVQLNPGTDGALALAMINVIINDNLFDRDFVNKYTVGFEALSEHIKPFTPEWASSITGITADKIREIATVYASVKPACIQWGNGVDMSNCAFHTARSILILKSITGNIDRPGGDVFWVGPEGFRQCSPLINQEITGGQFLPPEKRAASVDAGKYEFFPFVHPPTLWKSIVNSDPYRIKALWIIGSNPLVTGTSPRETEKALKLLDFVVVSDLFMTPTTQLADLVLPAASWLEQNDIANFHKIWCVLSRQKLAQIGEAQDDREVILQLAKRLGLKEAFPWNTLDEYRDWVLNDTGMTFEQFCEKGIATGTMRYYKYREEGFHTPSNKIELFSSIMDAHGSSPLPIYKEQFTPGFQPEDKNEYPIMLIKSGKVREYFHSEGRQIESLRKALPDPIMEIHPDTASEIGINTGDWVWIETMEGRIKMRAKLFDGIAPGVISAQHGWWFPEEAAPDYGWKKSNVNLLFGEKDYDFETGSESFNVPCRVYLAQ